MANTLSPELKAKILATFNSLNQGLVEREQILKVALLTMLAGENLLLVGPPGTAKSLIARRVAQALTPIDQTHGYFEYLLTKFSTPEEIFGPLSIAALKNDCVKRNTAGYLPSVRIAFLDEIFKASSSILNALLTILNERLYHNGAEPQKVPLQALIAASNELPTGQDELNALYDRFLLRVFVDYVSLDNLPQLFAKTSEPSITAFTEQELQAIQQAAQAVTTPTEIVQAIQQIWQKHREMFKEDRREQLSDRRLKKLIHLLNVAAATNGRTEVNLSDVLLLKDCLWNHPDNAVKVRDMITAVLRDFSYPIVSAPDDKVADIAAFLQGHSISSQEDETYSPLANNKPSNSKSVIKGYKGSGTKTDPILISNYQEIAGLERPDVGQKGYYFRQIADIDCSVLSTWPEIVFQGHYDGCGHSVIYNKQQQQQTQDKHLFSNIKQQSNVINLRVKAILLAKNADDSDISACSAFVCSLLNTANNCRITACESSEYLIVQNAKQCEITRCQSGKALIGDTATACTIANCFSVFISNDMATQ